MPQSSVSTNASCCHLHSLIKKCYHEHAVSLNLPPSLHIMNLCES